jgi:hypothetical protein
MRRTFFFLFFLMLRCQIWAADDVDTRIPVNSITNDKTFVLVIANENYKHEQPVPFALNDGEVFAVYCEKTLGVPAKNIRRLADASLNDMNHELDWLTKVVQAHDGEAQAIVYYSGHGMPDEDSKEAYLLPVDGYSTDPGSGLSTKKLYSRLNDMKSQRTLVFLDACFSGAKREGGMMSESRGVAIKVKDEPVKGNLVVFSAAQGNETAYPYKGHQHGMFTYFVLDKLNQTGGSVSLGELSDYVTKQVKQNSILENDKSQTPMIAAASDNAVWRNWKLAERAAKDFETRTPTKPTAKPRVSKNASQTNGLSGQGSPLPTPISSAKINYTMPTYTIEGAGTGIQGTYLVKVTMTVKKPEDAKDDNLAKCAVHGVLFRGFQGDRQHQRPLAGSVTNEQKNADFYNVFFEQQYLSYATTESSSRTATKTGKEYKVSALVNINKDQLRKDLTQQGALRDIPTLMVIPADSWCAANGYMKSEDGKQTPDYEKAWQSNQDLFNVVAKIGELMTDRGFPLKDMSQSLKDIAQARADILMEVGWKVNKSGPKQSVTYTLRGLDAYTHKQVAAGSGTGQPSFSAELPILIEEAILERMDNFADQLQAHFDDLLQNGREVSVTIKAEKGIKFSQEFEGEELTDIINDWMAQNTVGQRFSLSNADDATMDFEQVRIVLYADNGAALDTRQFVNGLRKMLSAAPYNISSKIEANGLGKATLILGTK